MYCLHVIPNTFVINDSTNATLEYFNALGIALCETDWPPIRLVEQSVVAVFDQLASMSEMICTKWHILHVGGVAGHEGIVLAIRFVLCSDFLIEVQALPTIPLVHSERLEFYLS